MPEPPPIEAHVDLRDFPWMPLDVQRVRASTTAQQSGDAFRAAVLLWCAAWHEVPAGSLPNSEKLIAGMAGYHVQNGHLPDEWLAIREAALRGFKQHSDGRLYHRVIVTKAIEAWGHKQGREAEKLKAKKQRDQARERQRRRRERQRQQEQNQ